MKPKLIIRLPTDDISKIDDFMDKFRSEDEVVMPESISFLIKDKDGYWHKIDDASLGSDVK